MGSGRSGSTWLLNLLRTFEDVVPVDEPLIGAHLATPVSAVTTLEDPGGPLIYEESRGRASYVFSDVHEAAWRPGLRRLIVDRLAAEVVAADAPRRSLVVVKEPNGSLSAPLLMAVLPESRLLFLVRDGRDVVDSSLDAVTARWATGEDLPPLEGRDRERYIERRAEHWVRATEATWTAYESHDPARRLLVRYEDLRADTPAELDRILTWVGRSADAAEIRQVADRFAFESLPEERKGSGQFARSATPGLWRERFSPAEQAALHRVLGPMLERVGYDAG